MGQLGSGNAPGSTEPLLSPAHPLPAAWGKATALPRRGQHHPLTPHIPAMLRRRWSTSRVCCCGPGLAVAPLSSRAPPAAEQSSHQPPLPGHSPVREGGWGTPSPWALQKTPAHLMSQSCSLAGSTSPAPVTQPRPFRDPQPLGHPPPNAELPPLAPPAGAALGCGCPSPCTAEQRQGQVQGQRGRGDVPGPAHAVERRSQAPGPGPRTVLTLIPRSEG